MLLKNKVVQILKITLLGVILVGVPNLPFSFSGEVRYESGGRRDPFVPVTSVKAEIVASSGILIEGIIYDAKGKSLVVVAGETYSVGDVINGQKILKIDADKIVVLDDGKERNFWVSQSDQPLPGQSSQEGKNA